jgi:hypothetical protein
MSFPELDRTTIGENGWSLLQVTSANRWSLVAGNMRACRINLDRWRSRVLFTRNTRLLIYATSTASFNLTYGNSVPLSIDKIIPSTVSVLATWYTPWTYIDRNPCLPTNRYGGMTGGSVVSTTIDTIPASGQGLIVSSNSQTVQVFIARL